MRRRNVLPYNLLLCAWSGPLPPAGWTCFTGNNGSGGGPRYSRGWRATATGSDPVVVGMAREHGEQYHDDEGDDQRRYDDQRPPSRAA
jgi:hypothetical protein